MTKAIREEGRTVAIKPMPDDLFKASRGLLKTKGKALARLLADRKANTR
jgi:hypothetical protein